MSIWLALALAAATRPRAPSGPIVFDGRIDERWWHSARRTPLDRQGTTMLTRWRGDRLTVALRLPRGTVRYLDLYVADARGVLMNFHASLRQGERRLSVDWTDARPAFSWGPGLRWQASTASRDARSNPTLADGYELEVPAALMGSPPWRVRVESRDFFGGPDIAWPAQSTRERPDTWGRIERPGTPAL